MVQLNLGLGTLVGNLARVDYSCSLSESDSCR